MALLEQPVRVPALGHRAEELDPLNARAAAEHYEAFAIRHVNFFIAKPVPGRSFTDPWN
ncbi:hypothetical protein ACWGIN_01345 [Streptomyces sp. NPDC054861]